MSGFLAWIGGGLKGMAATGVATGIFFIAFGVLPWEYAVEVILAPPYWLTNGWVRLGAVVIGLALIWWSLKWNVWSRRQKVVDELAEMLSTAIHDLLNRFVTNDIELQQFIVDYKQWCKNVEKVMESHPAYFSKADVLHFRRLGQVPIWKWGMAYRATPEDGRHNHQLCMLSLKFDRLRDVINWTQQRTR